MKIEFTIHVHLLSEANNSQHWTKKRTRRKTLQTVVKAYFNYSSPKVTLPCKVTLCRIAPREFDEDNLIYGFKGIKDQVADCLIPGLAKGRADGDKRISWEYLQEKGKTSQYAIRIAIEWSSPLDNHIAEHKDA